MIKKLFENLIFCYVLTRENAYFRNHDNTLLKDLDESNIKELKNISYEMSYTLAMNLVVISIFIFYSYVLSIISIFIIFIFYYKLNSFIKKYENYKNLKELSFSFKRNNWISDAKVLVFAYLVRFGIIALAILRFILFDSLVRVH